LVFADGSRVEADAIVFATGFERGMHSTISNLLGKDIANQVDEFWGIDDEGEINGVFKPSGCKLKLIRVLKLTVDRP
jgi:hypothetical protein